MSRPPPADQRLKMIDIARIAGVSPSTVSRALAGSPLIPENTREQIQQIAVQHGYVVNQSARRLRQSRTMTIGVVIPVGHEADQPISDPFFLELFGCLADEISNRNYDVLLTRLAAPTPGWLLRHIQSQRADGYIIVGQSDQHEVLNEAARTFMPMVVWGAHLPEQAYCSVGSDNVGGGRAAVDHLLKSGRRRIVFLGAAALPEIEMRLQGYRSALTRAQVEIDPKLIVAAHFTGETAYAAVRDLVDRKVAFDAIFAASDIIALSALRALADCGVAVPHDIAVVGFDGLGVAEHAHPRLTTIRQDLRRGAATLVEFLFRRIAGEEPPSATLPVELLVRESSGGAGA
ncbi:MAG: LacI family DNA-binding transcriptional regulator [Caulobacteraceae bacterium]